MVKRDPFAAWQTLGWRSRHQVRRLAWRGRLHPSTETRLVAANWAQALQGPGEPITPADVVGQVASALTYSGPNMRGTVYDRAVAKRIVRAETRAAQKPEASR